MTPLFAGLLLSGFALVLVAGAVILRAVEHRFPAVSEWLDRHVGEPRAWE